MELIRGNDIDIVKMPDAILWRMVAQMASDDPG